MTPVLAILFLGFVLGVRHATDADHVVAVTTMVSRSKSVRAAGLVGAVWGVGHTVTIFVVGGAIILFHVVVPARLGLAMEFGVALMLVALGVTALRSSRRDARSHTRPHDHPSAPTSLRPMQLARSLAVGVMHGLAGSAAIALLVLTTIRETKWALVYLAVFGGGTVLGMALLTSMISLPFALAAEKHARLREALVGLASIMSIGLGVVLAYRFGIVDGLLFGDARWTPE